jgi:hypothetical protein
VRHPQQSDIVCDLAETERPCRPSRSRNSARSESEPYAVKAALPAHWAREFFHRCRSVHVSGLDHRDRPFSLRLALSSCRSSLRRDHCSYERRSQSETGPGDAKHLSEPHVCSARIHSRGPQQALLKTRRLAGRALQKAPIKSYETGAKRAAQLPLYRALRAFALAGPGNESSLPNALAQVRA